MKRFDHGFLIDAQKFAVCHGGRRLHAYRPSDEAPFSEKLSLAQYAQSCFLASLGYDRELNSAFLNVEDRVSRISLQEDRLFLGKSYDFPSHANSGKKFFRVEVGPSLGQRGWRQAVQGLDM
jgi:hypothetical protein